MTDQKWLDINGNMYPIIEPRWKATPWTGKPTKAKEYVPVEDVNHFEISCGLCEACLCRVPDLCKVKSYY